MFSTLRNRFGIPGVISVIALVFAMIGGAYAANNGGSNNGATASAKKAAKGPRGPKGAQGPAGLAGPAGAQGPKGDAGANGSNGTPGKDGANGKDGVGVTTNEFEGVGGPCDEGGVELESASPEPAYVCSGKPGSPWTVGGTLPSEETLTGSFGGIVGDMEFTPVPIPFAIPLATGIPAGDSHFRPVSSPNADCPGTAASPQAGQGKLCVYVIEEAELTEKSFQIGSSGTGGTQIFIEGTPGGYIYGSWAVTAP